MARQGSEKPTKDLNKFYWHSFSMRYKKNDLLSCGCFGAFDYCGYILGINDIIKETNVQRIFGAQRFNVYVR